MIHLLLARGADIHAADAARDQPIHAAVRAAVRAASTDMLTTLMKAGASVNAIGVGEPPLHLAARAHDCEAWAEVASEQYPSYHAYAW